MLLIFKKKNQKLAFNFISNDNYLGDFKKLETLILNGEDVNSRVEDDNWNTLLMIAAARGNLMKIQRIKLDTLKINVCSWFLCRL